MAQEQRLNAGRPNFRDSLFRNQLNFMSTSELDAAKAGLNEATASDPTSV